jgi:hypothetical protein
MAYNSIYQISTQPIPEEDVMTADDIGEEDYRDFAEYVADTDKKKEVEYFRSFLEGNELAKFHAEDSFSLNEEGVAKYLLRSYDAFHEYAELLTKVSPDEFVSGNKISMWIEHISGAFYHGGFGSLYIADEMSCYREFISLETWLRGADTRRTYYIGGAVLYAN